jgi:hypothetical protein
MDIRTKVDESLRETRIPVYKELWIKTALLPKWSRSEDVTYEMIIQFSADLRDWYFNQGGMFLSQKARGAYGDLQDTIHTVLSEGATGRMPNHDYHKVRNMCSKLRTELTNDLLSRRGAPSLF